jgi:invasion protein IalB
MYKTDFFFARLLQALLFVFVALTLSPGAEAKPEKNKKFDDWGIVCETTPSKAEKCFVSQVQTMKEGGKVLLKFSAGYIGPKGEPTAVAMLPLGILLPAGAIFRVGDNPDVKMVIQSCTIEGCAAVATLDADTLKAMKQEDKKMFVAVMSSSDKKQINIPVSLKGFKRAFDSLE